MKMASLLIEFLFAEPDSDGSAEPGEFLALEMHKTS